MLKVLGCFLKMNVHYTGTRDTKGTVMFLTTQFSSKTKLSPQNILFWRKQCSCFLRQVAINLTNPLVHGLRLNASSFKLTGLSGRGKKIFNKLL